MPTLFQPDPVALPGLAALAVGLLAFMLSGLAARRGRVGSDAAAQRLSVSTLGVALQAVGFALTGAGRIRVALDPLSPRALIEAALVAALMATAVLLFRTATVAMGRNWSIRARTRADHELVQDGPFRLVRNPIYLAMFLLLLAFAVAFGHVSHLLVSVPLFALGTVIRVRSEEALLGVAFGAAYTAYAARVKRFVPGLF